MTTRRRSSLSALVNVLRNLPLTASVIVKLAARGRAELTWGALRAAGRPSRRFIRAAARRVAPVVATLALAADGHEPAAVEELERLWTGAVEDRNAAGASRALDALNVLHRFREARERLDRAKAAGLRINPSSEARLLVAEGQYRSALRVLEASRGGRALKNQVRGELDLLETGGRLRGGWSERRSGTVGRVTHLVTTALPEAQTGYTLRTQGIAKAQVAEGMVVEVISRLGFPVDRGALTADPDVWVDGVGYHRLLPARGLPATAAKRIDLAVELVVDRVERTGAEVLHAHSKHDNAQVALAVRSRTGIPVVYEVRGFLEETWRSRGGTADSDRYRLTRQAETDCMLASDAVVTLSRSMRSEIIRRGIPPEKVHVVPNAVSTAFLEEPPSRAAARRGLGLPEDGWIIGIAGTLNQYEGIDVVIEALRAVDDPGLVFLVVGDGPDRARLMDLAHRDARVRFTGRVPHVRVREHVAAMDLFCVPRRRTPVTELVPPLKPLEALATGVPILVSDLPPLAELVADAGAGRLVAPDDPKRWAERLNELRYDPDWLAKAGTAGRAWAAKNRTWGRLQDKYREVYRSASAGVGTDIDG